MSRHKLKSLLPPKIGDNGLYIHIINVYQNLYMYINHYGVIWSFMRYLATLAAAGEQWEARKTGVSSLLATLLQTAV